MGDSSPLENIPAGRFPTNIYPDQLVIDEQHVLVCPTVRAVDNHIGFLRALAGYAIVADHWAVAGLGKWTVA